MSNYGFRVAPRMGTKNNYFDVLVFDKELETERYAATYLTKEMALLFANAQKEHQLLYDIIALIENRGDHKFIAEKCAAAKELFEETKKLLETEEQEEKLPYAMSSEETKEFAEKANTIQENKENTVQNEECAL